ncbi:hypothetical protein THA_877 [Thermosipho africanus TCF52B]|uniref:Uncharacterized protein n=1 Tax=Thermosipho africanus (strain TCF52B) TaxID=484019 RepID=B7IGX3_THEAB|nr:hypothetical protein [Thermosipho africanus]ACJ75337.1 hypothetical protein THA_877 [Thermosipho africanus TCF52B]
MYDISLENNIKLSEEMLFSFAVALYTDTAMFRTARSTEFLYLSKFLSTKRFEEVLETIYFEKIGRKNFVNQIGNTEFYEINGLSIAVCKFNNQDEYYAFIDGLFDALSLDVFISIIPEGIKVHVKKRHVQKIYHRILVPLQKRLNVKRGHGIWFDFYNYNLMLDALREYKN